MNATPEPRGTLVSDEDGKELQIARKFSLPVSAVWAAITESHLLERWIGRWEGDPASGKVDFFMTAEDPDAEAETVTIRECSPLRRLALDTSQGESAWHLSLEVEEVANGTLLTFAQAIESDPLGSVGPGWEYYLDRLSAVLTGNEVADVVWDDYYPSMSEYYESLS